MRDDTSKGIFREESMRFLIPLEYSDSFDLNMVLKGISFSHVKRNGLC